MDVQVCDGWDGLVVLPVPLSSSRDPRVFSTCTPGPVEFQVCDGWGDLSFTCTSCHVLEILECSIPHEATIILRQLKCDQQLLACRRYPCPYLHDDKINVSNAMGVH